MCFMARKNLRSNYPLLGILEAREFKQVADVTDDFGPLVNPRCGPRGNYPGRFWARAPQRNPIGPLGFRWSKFRRGRRRRRRSVGQFR